MTKKWQRNKVVTETYLDAESVCRVNSMCKRIPNLMKNLTTMHATINYNILKTIMH